MIYRSRLEIRPLAAACRLDREMEESRVCDTVPSRKFRLPVGTNYRSRTEINYIEVDVYYATGSLFR